MNYAVIMAGGSGKRLWPLSRQKRPKQVLKLIGGQTLLRKCYQRLEGIFDPRNIVVMTNAAYVDTVRDELGELPKENIIAEPAMRDTASAIGLAATILHKQDADARMAIVTADQILEPTETFRCAMQSALGFVNENPEALLTFGIQPTFPSTQFGYIKFGSTKACKLAQNPIHEIDSFREKPDQKTAEQYLRDGNYSWNSGLFVWRCDTILGYLKQFVPGCVEPLEKIWAQWGGPEQVRALQEWFPKLPKISIDYAVMEKAKSVYGIELNCKWLDLGSFTALKDIINPDACGNTVVSKYKALLDSKNNIVLTEDNDHLIALIGVENMIVAHTKDATLVCPIGQSERLKELLDQMKADDYEVFL